MSWTRSLTGSDAWLVTGASTGLGRALTEELLATGSAVIATARDPLSVADLCQQYPDTVKVLELDVTNHERVASVIDQARDVFGGIDVVVNNAGYALIGAFEELEVGQVRAQLETNFIGP